MKYTLRSVGRELLRGFWGRYLVYPRLAARERSPGLLNAAIAHRARRIGVAVDADGTRLRRLDPGAALLTKGELQRHPERFLRPRGIKTLLRSTIRTSGTSGTPLALVQTLGAVIREEGFVQRQLRWIGYRHGQRRAWIRGDIVCPERPADGRYWCHDWFGRILMMSSYHLSNATMGAYIGALERHDPVVIHAYPSSVGALAAWLGANGRRYRGAALRGVFTSSETLEPDVRGAVEAAFGAPVYDWYGQAERVVAIGTCERGNYHVLTDYGGVELLDLEDGSCELVGTTLNNPAMPLSRYRTGDRVIPGSGAPCACGRVFPTVKAVIGRQERSVTLPDGRIVARLDRVFQGHERGLLEGQVLYRGDARFVLRVVATEAFGAADEAALIDKFLLRVPGVEVRVERVPAIARGPNGKYEFIAFEM
ncbi:phenylacetate--CoA ligase family protein [Massilia sp.]|uniref:phenylacetate--CoA ligase family protein n=1 Tax=Massilia sp. TaxID=1882437 RepID=UPI0028A8F62E|nr:phenylacetate--CoA ligase family protein [Massilia sp.]